MHEKAGYFGLHAISEDGIEEMIKHQSFEIWGYPEEHDGEQWGMKGQIEKIDKYNLYYTQIQTSSGQGGSPVYYQKDESYWIIGVHRGKIDLETGLFNIAARLSLPRVKNILGWMDNYFNVILPDGETKQSKLKALLEQKNFKVRNLQIRDSSLLSEEILSLVAKSENTKILMKLDLKHGNINPSGAKKLAQNSLWTNLHTLNLSKNNIDDKGAVALAKSKTDWINLRILKLTRNSIGDDGAIAWFRNIVSSKLHTLKLSKNRIS